MTDLLDTEAPEEEDVEHAPPPARPCQHPGCPNGIPAGAHHFARYCTEHAPPKKERKPKKDKPPTTVKIDLGASKAAPKTDAQAKARVEQLVNMVAGGLAMAGQTADAADVMRVREQWAAAVIELAKYEPWLQRLLQGGETSGRVMAWVAVALSTLAMVAPIALRHGWVPSELRPTLAAVVAQDSGVSQAA